MFSKFLKLHLFLILFSAPSLASAGEVNVGLSLEPPHLDPTAGAAGAIDNVTYSNLFEGLTRINRKGEVEASLAKNWKISKDGLTYNFFLRKNVTFHDGTAFDADDVVFSLNRARGDNSVNAQKLLFETIKTVKAKNPYEVEITLKRPNSQLPYNLAWGDAVIVNPENADKNKQNPIGTGPFMFKEWKKGQNVTLTINDKYYGKKPKIELARFNFLADPVAAFSAVTTGKIDLFPFFPAPEQAPRFVQFPKIDVVSGTTEGETILAINNKRFSDKNIRLAISHAINKQDLIDAAMFGYGTIIGSHFAPHNPYYLDLTKRAPYNVKLAKEYLQKSNYKGEEITIDLPPPSYARRSGEIIAAQLRAIGMKVKIQNVEWAVWLKRVFKETNYDLTIISHTEPNDINIYARPNYYFNYNNPEFSKIIDKIPSAGSDRQLKKLYQQAQKIIADDAVNVFLFQLPRVTIVNKDLKGFWKNSPIQAVDLTHVYWK